MATKVTGSEPKGWNLCKVKLRETIRELEWALNHSEHIRPIRRAKLRLTLTKLRGVAKIVGPIGCTSPLMTFDLRYSERKRSASKKR